MKFSKAQIKNALFFVFIALMIIPQTRKPIQIYIQKGVAKFSPSIQKEDERMSLDTYNWQLLDLNGNIHNFNNSKGKVIVLNFWATWCPPCIAEMPSLQALYNDYQEQVDFYFVSNEDASTIRAFLNKNNYSFKSFIPQTRYPNAFNISSIPRTFLIDRQGRIVIDKTGAANWDSEKVRSAIDVLLKND